MSKKGLIISLTAIALIFIAQTVSAEPGRIYGVIHTEQGDDLEGMIRWDKNEGAWDDILDGYKERTKKAKEESKDRRKYGEKDSKSKVTIFGVTIFSDDSYSFSGSSQSGISFGYIKRLVADNNGAELEMKDGSMVFLENSSTDLGGGIREIVIETTKEGELELVWDDIEYIDFSDGGADIESSFGKRIYGTVTTSRAGEFTGWITWDVDEIFTDDIIDGSENHRKRKIKFEDIASIERSSSQASIVVTKNGKEMRLDDSNDVDSGNRGIGISDLKLGRVLVDWDEFEKLVLSDPPRDAYPKYGDYVSSKIRGTVYDESGESFTGFVRWDNDEEETWEFLDGEYRGVNFDIPFANIKSIEKLSRRSARVTLWDGRQFRLRDSNDVNDENKGIYVLTDKDKDEAYIDWDEFERLEMSK